MGLFLPIHPRIKREPQVVHEKTRLDLRNVSSRTGVGNTQNFALFLQAQGGLETGLEWRETKKHILEPQSRFGDQVLRAILIGEFFCPNFSYFFGAIFSNIQLFLIFFFPYYVLR